jgi:hypothetical protein
MPTAPAGDPRGTWALYHEDTFDRETPLQKEASGRGLVKGLQELWARHLFETVRPQGGRGFSRFHLRWAHRDVRIVGEWNGAVRLREWTFGTREHLPRGYVQAGNKHLLRALATAHAACLLSGGSSEPILAAAASAAERDDFLAWLTRLDE